MLFANRPQIACPTGQTVARSGSRRGYRRAAPPYPWHWPMSRSQRSSRSAETAPRPARSIGARADRNAPWRGHSIRSNALVHVGADVVATMDVKLFYPSTTSEHVFRFFKHELGMIDDLAGALAKCCTIDGTVPLGFSVSPILCQLAYLRMFDQIAARCAQHDVKMSLYVDDITLSGKSVPGELISEIKAIARRQGLTIHKVQVTRIQRNPTTTGVVLLENGGTRERNSKNIAIRDTWRSLRSVQKPVERLPLVLRLIGQEEHKRDVRTGPISSASSVTAIARLRRMERELTKALSGRPTESP